MKINLALKFGSHEIIIYRKGFGIIAKEPTYLAVTPRGKRKIVKAVGVDAERLKDKNARNVVVYQPIKNGEVVDLKMASILLRKILEKTILDKFTASKISALVAVPCAMGVDQYTSLKTALLQGGIDSVTFVPNGVCAREYVNNLVDVNNVLVVDIGKCTTDISILNNYNFICGRDYFIGGQDMDFALLTYIQDNFGLEVTLQEAEKIKAKIASLYENDFYSCEFSGINENKLFEKATINATETKVAIQGVYDKIFYLIKTYLDSLPKGLSAEIYKNGVILSGGSCKIAGLTEYAQSRLMMPIIEIDNPVDAVVLGLAKLLDMPKKSLIKIDI